MGIDSVYKRWLLARYGAQAILAGRETLVQGSAPRTSEPDWFGSEVAIWDAMYLLKPDVRAAYSRDGMSPMLSGADWVRRHVLRRPDQFYESGGRIAYLCFDRGSPLNKQAEHAKRYGESLSDGELGSISQHALPADWTRYVNDHRTLPELLHFVARSALWTADSRQADYALPVGGQLFLHGVYWDGSRPNWTYARNRPPKVPDPVVHFAENAPVRDERTGVVLSHRRSIGTDPRHLESEVGNLVEGEIACLYFCRFHPTQTITVVSVDGDLLPLLLMASRDRIDRGTGLFRNRVLLRLVVPGKRDLVIDVNLLYVAVSEDPILREAGVADPVLSVCALCCLVENDFLRDFARGVGVYVAKPEPFKLPAVMTPEFREKIAARYRFGNALCGTAGRCPWIVLAFFADAKRYARLFVAETHLDGSRRRTGDLETPVEVRVHDELFIEFAKSCYVHKHGPTARSYDVGEVRAHLARRSNHETRMLVAREARVYARQTRWVLLYWTNGWRRGCVVPSPIARYRTLPYYGWALDSRTHACVRARKVSVKRVVDGDLDGSVDLSSHVNGEYASGGTPVVYYRGHHSERTAEIARRERARRQNVRFRNWHGALVRMHVARGRLQFSPRPLALRD